MTFRGLELATFILEQSGASVIAVSSALEALQIFAQTKPDILLLDIGMPEMDGYTLLRQMRVLPPEQGGQIPAIALTAYAGEIDCQQAMAAGYNQHLAKPVDPEVLIKAIADLI
ncbi:response regulator [Leptolyngbya sp. FACHB-16]|uniref:response regulator n=1 Tax=unclassified Leptolyngbya TaxID=2650499 RepID=UPI001689B560|nr:response regulator [Leptolyngbya sp. FACHB-16]MBD2153997.1 response regulator [Leptolyngbya sp. FACHB-16]